MGIVKMHRLGRKKCRRRYFCGNKNRNREGESNAEQSRVYVWICQKAKKGWGKYYFEERKEGKNRKQCLKEKEKSII